MAPIYEGTASTYGEPETLVQLAAAWIFHNPLRPILLAVLVVEIVWGLL